MRGQIVILMSTALVEKDGKYLVLKRSQSNLTNKGRWQFPEGKVKFGESILKALKREVREETSLTVVDSRLIGIHSSIYKKRFRLFRSVFRCRVAGSIKLSVDHSQYDWLSKKELDRLNFVEGFSPKNMISVK